MKIVPFVSAFDNVFTIRITPSIGRKYEARVLGRGGDWVNFGSALVARLVQKGSF